jgi:hypothetical protein
MLVRSVASVLISSGGQHPSACASSCARWRPTSCSPRCAGLRSHPTQPIQHRATIIGLRRTAQRALALQAEADDLQAELDILVDRLAPRLLAEPGVGVICAAQLLTAWSHPGRLRSEAAFAMLGGAAPIQALSGRSSVTASTAVVTGSATAPYTPSSCRA